MKLSLYFLFYIAMVLELLIFIVDRDDAEAKLRASVSRLAQAQVLRLDAVGPAKITVKKGDTGYGVIAVSGFWDEAERRTIKPVLCDSSVSSEPLGKFSRLDSIYIIQDSLRGGFGLRIRGLEPGVDTLKFGVLVHRSLSLLDQANIDSLVNKYRSQWLAPDTLIVRSDTLTIVVDIIEQGEKKKARGAQIGD